MFVLGHLIGAVTAILRFLIKIIIGLIIIRMLMFWFSPAPFHITHSYRLINNSIVRLTEPILGPIRTFMPINYRIGMDLSPAIVILLLWFFDMFVLSTLEQFAIRMKSK